jgi:hypothetical protein
VVNRGVAVWKGKVYVGSFDGRLIALDAKTGKVAWSVDTVLDRKKSYTITGAPRIVKGKVLIGNGGAEFGVRGYITAYDAETGKQAWRFYTVPGDPALPPEDKAMEMALKTWSGNNWGSGAAAARCGTRWPTTLSWTCCTSAPATARPGTTSSAAKARATTCSCPPSSRCGPTPASTSGTTRPRRRYVGLHRHTAHHPGRHRHRRQAAQGADAGA